jgi:hypothetical protein
MDHVTAKAGPPPCAVQLDDGTLLTVAPDVDADDPDRELSVSMIPISRVVR